MRGLFGDKKKAEHAERLLHRLKQTKDTAAYAVEFKRLAAISRLPEAALFTPFYNGLKTHVQDEIYQNDRPSTFGEYVEDAITADKRSFERFMDRKRTTTTKAGNNALGT